MSNSIPINNIVAFPSVRANTREMRSFTEQNVANLISHLFVDISKGEKDGFSVCEHTISNDTWVLFNLGGRFFDVNKSSFGSNIGNLYVGINIDTFGTPPSLEIIGGVESDNYKGLYYGSDKDDVSSCNYKIKLYSSGNLDNKIHLYVDESAQGDNAYQTKSQITEVYGQATDDASITGNLYQKVKAILAIDTINGGTIGTSS